MEQRLASLRLPSAPSLPLTEPSCADSLAGSLAHAGRGVAPSPFSGPSLPSTAPCLCDGPAMDVGSPDDGRVFQEGLRHCLQRVESYALTEWQRQEEALTLLHAENSRLRESLARHEAGVDGAPAGNGSRHECGNVVQDFAGSAHGSEGQQNFFDFEKRRLDVASTSLGTVGDKLSAASSEQESLQTQPKAQSKQPGRSSFWERSKTVLFGAGNPVWQSRTMTENVRSLLQRGFDRHEAYKTVGFAQLLARSEFFENVTLVLVVLNAFWIAIDIDYNGQPMLQSPPMFQIIENTFVAVFLFEMMVRFAAYRSKLSVLRDAWFLFDASLVLVMIIESWLFTIVLVTTQSEGYSGVGILSALRIMRLLRVVRVAKLCTVVPELQTIIGGMFAGIRSVLITASVLLAITYTFAILLRQLGVSSSWGSDYFSSVPMAIYTLLVSAMLPDNLWLLDRIKDESWYCAVIYFVFLLLTAVTVMNMLVGVLCDDIFRVSHEEKETRALDNMSEKLLAILREVDQDFNGYVSRSEFESIVEHESAVRILADVGVDVVALVGDADFIFSHEGTQLPFERFKKEVLQFRSSNYATIGSVTAARRLTQRTLEGICARLANMEHLLWRQQGFAHLEDLAPLATVQKTKI